MPVIASVVASTSHDVLKPIHARTKEAAAYIFRACNSTQSGTLSRWEFATALEMMMRRQLVSFLIDQIDAARIDAEFAEAAQGSEECGLDTFTRWFEKFDLCAPSRAARARAGLRHVPWRRPCRHHAR